MYIKTCDTLERHKVNMRRIVIKHMHLMEIILAEINLDVTFYIYYRLS